MPIVKTILTAFRVGLTSFIRHRNRRTHSLGVTLSCRFNLQILLAFDARRGSTIDLTMNVYTDPRLLDVHGALNALPKLTLDAVASARRTGTDDSRGEFAPAFVPKGCKPSANQSITDTTAGNWLDCHATNEDNVSCYAAKRKQPLTSVVNGCHRERATGFEPATSSLGS